MVTTTPKLSLTKPLSTESMAQGDNVLSGNYDIIDDMVGASVVSVSGDIASPLQTQMNYETSTDEASIYDGTEWKFIGGPNIGQGKRGYNESASKITVVDGSPQRVLNVQFAAVNGRKYLVNWKLVVRVVNGTEFRAYASLYFTGDTGTDAPFATTHFITSQDIVVFVENDLVQQFTGFFEFAPDFTADPAAVSCWLDVEYDGDLEVSPFGADQTSISIEDWSS